MKKLNSFEVNNNVSSHAITLITLINFLPNTSGFNSFNDFISSIDFIEIPKPSIDKVWNDDYLTFPKSVLCKTGYKNMI
jgi:hypothetical protein